MSDYTFNLPVRPEQLQAIGMVACEWSYLESIVEAAIWNLAGLHDDAGASITTHLGMPLRLDILMTLFRLHRDDGGEADRLDKMCEHIRHKLSPKRGAAIHTLWVEGDHGSPMTYSVRARGKLEHEKKGRPAAEIREVAALIAAQSAMLQEFLKGHHVF